MITMKDLEEFEEYMASERLAEDYGHSAEDRKLEILDFLEKFMDVAELVDKTATKLLFPGNYLEMISGMKSQK